MACKVNRNSHGGGLKGHRARDPKALLLVRFEHVGKAKTLATDITRVRLFSCVCAPMTLHIRATGETLPADFTDEWLLTCKSKQEIALKTVLSGN